MKYELALGKWEHALALAERNTGYPNYSDLLLPIINRHKPRDSDYYIGTAQCGYCADQCHSGEGLSCDTPDAPWPCPDMIDVAVAIVPFLDAEQIRKELTRQ